MQGKFERAVSCVGALLVRAHNSLVGGAVSPHTQLTRFWVALEIAAATVAGHCHVRGPLGRQVRHYAVAVRPFVCPSLSVCLFVHLSLGLSVRRPGTMLSACLSVRLSVCLSVRRSGDAVYPSARLSVYQSVSFCLYVCLCVC